MILQGSPSSDLSAFFGGMIDVAYMVRHCFGRRFQLFNQGTTF